MSIMLRAAPSARDAIPARIMATPTKIVRYRDPDLGLVTVEPDRDFLVPDHPAVRANPKAFRRCHSPFSPQGRAERALEAELRDIQRQKRELARNTCTGLDRGPRGPNAPWHLAEPRTRTRTGRI